MSLTGGLIRLIQKSEETFFSLLNGLNTSLQAKDANLLKTYDKVAAFKKKLRLWRTRLDRYARHVSVIL